MIGYQLSIRAARNPDAPALAYDARRRTYRELNERACRLAHAFAAIEIARGDRVAVLLHNCDAFVEILFAAAKLGAIFVPLNFRLVAREIALQLAACTPKLLVAGKAFEGVLGALADDPTLPGRRITIDDASGAAADEAYERWLGSHPPSEPDVEVAPEDVLMLMHSSGTTGLPKGIVFTHSSAYASCVAKIVDFDLRARDTTVVFGPLFHAGPLLDLALPLLMRGGRVVIGPSRNFDPSELMRTVAAERGTVIPIYPTMLRRVLAAPREEVDLSSLRLIVTGGEPTPLPVIYGVDERFPDVAFINNYGSTEGGPITTFLDPEDSLRKAGSVGKEAFGVEVRIADDSGRSVPDGQVGEVLVRSPFVCRGYWNRPEASAAARIGGWWRTGDLGRRDEEGFLWLVGRSKDLIKSGGESIFPIEVEQAIAELPGVEEVGVVGVPDPEWGEAVAAFIVKSTGAALDADAVVEHCRARLASYKKPRHVLFVDTLPRGTTSKVFRQGLRALWAASRSR